MHNTHYFDIHVLRGNVALVRYWEHQVSQFEFQLILRKMVFLAVNKKLGKTGIGFGRLSKVRVHVHKQLKTPESEAQLLINNEHSRHYSKLANSSSSSPLLLPSISTVTFLLRVLSKLVGSVY